MPLDSHNPAQKNILFSGDLPIADKQYVFEFSSTVTEVNPTDHQ